MSETWINIDGHTLRVLIRQVSGRPGVGHAQLSFSCEINNRDVKLTGLPLSFRGSVDVVGLGGPDVPVHLAQLATVGRDPVVRDPGIEESFTLAADVDDRQLAIVEAHRLGPLMFRLNLSCQTFRDSKFEALHVNSINHTVSQSDWIALLEQARFAQRLLIELEMPDSERNPTLAEAVAFFGQAQRQYTEGEWRHCVETLRHCLAALIGKKPDDEEELADVQAGLKDLNRAKNGTTIAYGERVEMARRSLKFYCDLGGHPEVAETRRHHAHAAVVMVAGLLEFYTANDCAV